MLSVGQKLWYVPNDKRDGYKQREVEVVKVGRKWAEVAPSWACPKIDIETLRADSGKFSCPGRCYLSKEEYENTALVNEEWANFHARVGRIWARPEHITREKLAELRTLIFGGEQ